MAIWAIVPVKPFLRAKSRLASVLTPQERAGLSREFLGHALDVLAKVPGITQTLVISRDPAALALAHSRQARTVTESGAPDLNSALQRATQVVVASRAQGVLILPTDLPFLTPEDVSQLIARRRRGAAGGHRARPPRRRHQRAFYAPPGLLNYAFGEHSFGKHLELAQAAGAHVRVCRLPGIALDVDGPEDWSLYLSARKP